MFKTKIKKSSKTDDSIKQTKFRKRSKQIGMRTSNFMLAGLFLLVSAMSTLAPLSSAKAAPAPSALPEFELAWGKYGSTTLQSPRGVATDSSGNVYVVDGSLGSVIKYDSSGNPLTAIGSRGSGNGELSYPRGVAVDSNGYIYVSDTDNNRIMVFDSNGQYYAKFGSNGSTNGKFNRPNAISLDSQGYIYVSDGYNNRIQKFSRSGTTFNFVKAFGSQGSNDGQFNYPSGIVIDSNNNVYVADNGNSRIQVFDTDGNYLNQFYSYYPYSIAIDSSDNIQVAKGWEPYVSVYSGEDFSSIGSYSLDYNIGGIANDPSGNIYVAFDNYWNARVTKYNSSYDYQIEFKNVGTAAGQFSWPSSVAIDSDSNNNVYVADTFNNRIQKFDSSGNYISQFGSYGYDNGQLRNPRALTVDTENNIYVVDTDNNRIQKFDSNGNYISQFGSGGGGDGQFSNPQGIAIDSHGNIYVSDGYNNRIQKFNNNGVYQDKFGSWGYNGPGQFAFPSGLAFDSNDDLYVTDSSSARVQKFSTKYGFVNNYITQLGTRGSADGQFNSTTGVTVDSEDNVYVADSSNSRIQKFNSRGEYLAKFGTYGTGDGQFRSPQGIAMDTANNLYVADSDNNRIQKFSPPLTSQSVYAKSPNGASTGSKVTLSVAPELDISCLDSQTEANQSSQDSSYLYPLGITHFCVDNLDTGSTQNIRLAYETNLTPEQVVARKYDSTTQTYSNIPGATITQGKLDNKNVLFVRYQVTDGGALDADGQANGTIVDPAGLGFAGTENDYNQSTWISAGQRQFTGGEANGARLVFNNNIPYVSYSDGSHGFKATVKKLVDGQWQTVGNEGFSEGQSFGVNMVFHNGTPYVFYQNVEGGDQSNDYHASVKKFDGTNWVDVGGVNDISGGAAGWVDLQFHGDTPYLIYQDGSVGWRLTLKKLVNNQWQSVGELGFTEGDSQDPQLVFNGNTPYVVYKDLTVSQGATTVMKFNGTSWVTVGAEGFSAGEANGARLQFYNNTPYVSYSDGGNGFKATVKKFNGTSWVTVGSEGFSEGQSYGVNMKIHNGTPYVYYQDVQGLDDYTSDYRAAVKKFNGTSWVSVGSDYVTEHTAGWIDLQFNNEIPYLVFQEREHDWKITLLKYVDNQWTPVVDYGLSDGDSHDPVLVFNGSTPYVIFKDLASGGKTTVMKLGASDQQPTVSTVSGTPGDKAVEITTPAGTYSTCSSSVSEDNLSAQDSNYQYPIGLVNFCFNTSYVNNEISVVFETDLTPSQVVARKYNPNTNTYTDIEGATITETTINGNHALKVTYNLVDNGPLDLNPLDGKIEDPVGLAYNPNSSNNNNGGGSGSQSGTGSSSIVNRLRTGVANTGLRHSNMVLPAIALLAGTTVLATLATRAARSKKQ